MKKYKKKVTYTRIEGLFRSHKNIVIGQFENTRIDFWKELKTNHELFIPKNTLCRVLFEDSLDWTKHPKMETTIFEGPIFCLATETDLQFSNVLTKLKQVQISVYGGIFEGKFYNFSDINEIHSLLKKRQENSENQPITHLLGSVLSAHQKLVYLNPFLNFQRVVHQKSTQE